MNEGKEIDAGMEVIGSKILGLHNREMLIQMQESQWEVNKEVKQTREELMRFNMIAKDKYSKINMKMKQHDKVLGQMKGDIDYIFQKIRILKEKIPNNRNEDE